MKEIKVAITGHRLERIKGQEKSIECWIIGSLKNLLACYDKVTLIDGMAQGVDQIAAFAAIKTGAQISCYFPYKKKLYGAQEYIADNAAEVRYICEKYSEECYIKRDRRMVDDCDLLLVVWDGKPWGGTYLTYQYALEKGKDILFYSGYDNRVKENWDSVEEGFNELPREDEEDEWD